MVPETLQIGFVLLIGPSFQLWDAEWVRVRGKNEEGSQKAGISKWFKERVHLGPDPR